MPKLQSVFLPSQLEELHKSYESAIILTKKSRSELIKLTGLSSTQVNNWFKNCCFNTGTSSRHNFRLKMPKLRNAH